MNSSQKIKILGAGPTGSLLSLGLAKLNLQVEILDPKEQSAILNRTRAYAITHSSRLFLRRINLWEQVLEFAKKFDRLVVYDTSSSASCLFKADNLTIYNSNSNSLGWIINHHDLMNILFQNIDSSPNITARFSASSDYIKDDYKLLVGADGSNSPLRKKLNIRSIKYKYKQSCLSFQVLMRAAQPNTALEIFRPEGPLAVLPMRGGSYQIVWTDSPDSCFTRSRLKSSYLLDSLASVLPSGFEPECLVSTPQVFPVALSIAHNHFKANQLIIGEASHSFHPVGGQGLNVCWRDVASLQKSLSSCISRNVSIKKAINSYSRSRFIDIIFTSFSTHSLIVIFSTKLLPLSWAKYIAFTILNKNKILRSFVFNLMTFGPLKL